MKFFLLLFTFPIIIQSQYTYDVLNYDVSDVIYSKSLSKYFFLYDAKVYEFSFDGEPSSLFISNLHPNTIGFVLTPDNNYFYTTLYFGNRCEKYNLITGQLEYSIDTGFDPVYGPIHPENLSVHPNDHNTVVVSRRLYSNPYHGGVVVYDGLVNRPNYTPYGYGSNFTQFINEHTLIGINNEVQPPQLRFLNLNENGVNDFYVFDDFIESGYLFIIHGDRVFMDNGHVLSFNLETPSIDYITRLHYSNKGKVLYDQENDYIVYFFETNTDKLQISRYNAVDLSLVDDYIIDLNYNIPVKLTSCGTDCYLTLLNDFSTSHKIVRFIKTDIMSTHENNEPEINLYPNPTHGQFSIKTDLSLSQIRVLNLLGQTIENIKVNNSNQYDISHLSTGVYLVNVIDRSNFTHSFKIIKK